MSGTILLADDSLTIQKVVELTFADTDYRVIAVSSGDELLDRLTDSQPNLIICDVIMPGRDGYEVCQQIKSNSEWLHLPVILLTGTFEPFDRDRAIAAGCSEIITKPFEARKLVDTVERLIGSSDIQTPQASDEGPTLASEGESWPEEATPIDIPRPAEAESEEFGTQLSPPTAEVAAENEADGIEFTTSGFAEMEAAGRKPSDPAAPESGLEYEADAAHADESESPDPAVDPPQSPAEDISAQTVRIDVSSFREASEAEEDSAPIAEPEAETPAIEDVAAPPDASAETAPGPFETAEEEPSGAAFESESEDEGPFKDESSMADTSPVEAPPEDGEVVEGVATGQLSEEDIDRIARRVVDLATDRLDQIAWEVVPDVAEIVVRQRIRELEAESETSAPDSVQ